MSQVTESNVTRNQAFFDYDYTKRFLRNNLYRTINIEASGADLVLEPGALIGTIAASAKGAILKSAAADGSQYPTGVCAEGLTILDGQNADVNICIAGEIAEEKIVLDGTDTLNTVIDGRIIRDRIAADTLGIKLVATDSLAEHDNS